MTTTPCTVCGATTRDVLLCGPCTRDLTDAITALPGLIDDVVTRAIRQTKVYRPASRRAQPDEDWRGSEHALEPTGLPPDLYAGRLLGRARNTLTTWCRHLAETRGTTVTLDGLRDPHRGPVCAAHVHRPPVVGCLDQPSGCRAYHPDHTHTRSDPGCPDDCRRLHCAHASCHEIRTGERVGTARALVRWLLLARDSIRVDEAAGVIYDQLLRLRDDLAAAVDSAPSPFFAGPCHSTEGGTRCERDLYMWPGYERYITCDGYRSDTPGDEGCGAVHSAADRERFLLDAVEDALLPLATWQQALPKLFPGIVFPHRATWWRWTNPEAENRRLLPRSIDRAGAELFRGGDVIDLVREEQARITGNRSKTKDKRERMAS